MRTREKEIERDKRRPRGRHREIETGRKAAPGKEEKEMRGHEREGETPSGEKGEERR